jgi:hypothetical protein
MSIRIEETTTTECEQYTLFVNDVMMAHAQVHHDGVKLNWAVYGPQQWPEAKLLLEGLLELGLLADQLTVGTYHAQKGNRRAAQPRSRTQSSEDEAGAEEGEPLVIRYGRHHRKEDERTKARNVLPGNSRGRKRLR